MIMKTVIIATVALAALSTLPIAQADSTPPAHAAKVTALICPVTGNKIASIKDAAGHSTYKGQTYYFCCPGCKPKFDKDPAKFIANAAKGKYEKM